MTSSVPPSDPLRQTALELIAAARSFLDAAEKALADDDTVAEWAGRGREVVHEFLGGLSSRPAADADGGGIEHIDLD